MSLVVACPAIVARSYRIDQLLELHQAPGTAVEKRVSSVSTALIADTFLI